VNIRCVKAQSQLSWLCVECSLLHTSDVVAVIAKHGGNHCDGFSLLTVPHGQDDEELVVFGKITGKVLPAVNLRQEVPRNQRNIIQMCPPVPH